MLGLPINFGFSETTGDKGLGITFGATDYTGFIILQSADVSLEAKEEQVSDAVGALAVRHFYDSSKKATLEYTPTGTNIAASITHSTIGITLVPGTLINIATCAAMPDLVCTSTQRWVVVPGVKISKANNGAAKVSLPIEFHAGIHA